MRKILLRVCILMMAMVLGLGAAQAEKPEVPEGNILCPETFVTWYNNALSYLLRTRYEGNMTDDEIQSVTEALSVSYTEILNNGAYYNNSDWTIELSGYYNEREVNVHEAADSLTFSVDDSEINDSIRFEVELAISLVLNIFDDTHDMGEIMEGFTGNDEEADSGFGSLQFKEFVLSWFAYEGRHYYAMIKSDFESSAKELIPGLYLDEEAAERYTATQEENTGMYIITDQTSGTIMIVSSVTNFGELGMSAEDMIDGLQSEDEINGIKPTGTLQQTNGITWRTYSANIDGEAIEGINIVSGDYFIRIMCMDDTLDQGLELMTQLSSK